MSVSSSLFPPRLYILPYDDYFDYIIMIFHLRRTHLHILFFFTLFHLCTLCLSPSLSLSPPHALLNAGAPPSEQRTRRAVWQAHECTRHSSLH